MTSITADHIAILLGILFLLFAIVQTYKLFNLIRRGIKQSATIIDFFKHSKRRGYTTYFPILEFNTQEGELIHIKSYIGLDQSHQKKVGETIDIIYNPIHPREFIIQKGMDQYMKVFGSLFIGIAFIVSGYFKLFSYTP